MADYGLCYGLRLTIAATRADHEGNAIIQCPAKNLSLLRGRAEPRTLNTFSKAG